MKPYYYTFEWKDRLITLCFNWEDLDNPSDNAFGTQLYMGYSVKLPQDEHKENFAKQIALGRAVKEKTQIWIGCFEDWFNLNIRSDKGFLKAIARNCERNIKNGTIIIKGIR